jgi:hypothetical protein
MNRVGVNRGSIGANPGAGRSAGIAASGQNFAARSGATNRSDWQGRRHGGFGRGFGVGVAAGALIGSPPYYYGGAYPYRAYDDGYGYDNYAYAVGGYEAYGAAPAYVGEGDDAYCAQRYRSYDPRSGTFLGYDGARHPCP